MEVEGDASLIVHRKFVGAEHFQHSDTETGADVDRRSAKLAGRIEPHFNPVSARGQRNVRSIDGVAARPAVDQKPGRRWLGDARKQGPGISGYLLFAVELTRPPEFWIGIGACDAKFGKAASFRSNSQQPAVRCHIDGVPVGSFWRGETRIADPVFEPVVADSNRAAEQHGPARRAVRGAIVAILTVLHDEFDGGLQLRSASGGVKQSIDDSPGGAPAGNQIAKYDEAGSARRLEPRKKTNAEIDVLSALDEQKTIPAEAGLTGVGSKQVVCGNDLGTKVVGNETA